MHMEMGGCFALSIKTHINLVLEQMPESASEDRFQLKHAPAANKEVK